MVEQAKQTCKIRLDEKHKIRANNLYATEEV